MRLFSDIAPIIDERSNRKCDDSLLEYRTAATEILQRTFRRAVREPSGIALHAAAHTQVFMLPWVQLDTATVPDNGGTLTLMRRGEEFSIRAGSVVLMSSRMSSSEIALADVACERLAGRKNCRVLIGGYGMGFTLRAALAGLGTDAQIVVAELVPAVIAWAKGPMAALTGESLNDPRVSIHEGDVAKLIASSRGEFDAILLDVDNGPDSVSRDANNRLYKLNGLHAARMALKPRGLLAIWSAAPSAAFTSRLSQVGFKVEEIKARANKGRGVRHIIWVATKP